MSFDSFSDFLVMGGHGLYVWLCYATGLFVLGANWFAARAARTGMMKQLAQRQRREDALEQQMDRRERESKA